MGAAFARLSRQELDYEGGTEMFDIGDRVVHPIHGAGLVKGIKKQDLLEQYHRYYVIDLAVDDRTLMIPVGNAEEIGLRSISQEPVLSQVWHTLDATADTLSNDYKKRQKRIQEKLKTGNLIKVAEVIRDLSTLEREDHLTSFDTKLLDRAQQFLACELALVEGVQVSEAEQMIYETLDSGMELVGAQSGEEAAGEGIAEDDRSVSTHQRVRQLVERALKRLHPGDDSGTQKPAKRRVGQA
jgi:CarD family transcriptional regulator